MKKIAIVGATGLVGRMVLKILEEENMKEFKYKLFCSKKSAGTKLNFLGQDFLTYELTETSFDENFDYAIFVAGGEVSKKFIPKAIKNKCIVIDNSSYYRMDKNVPLIVPEVNSDKIKEHKGIISNPNCSTIQAVIVLKPLDEKYKIKRIIYSTYQAVSGAGIKGIEDLKFKNKGKNLKKFPYQIYNNCLPQIDIFTKEGYTKEEEKMINETRKILGNHILATATTVRVPVENCHCESINIEFENDFDIKQIKEILKKSKSIIVQDDISKQIYPLPINANGHNEVFVGRIRRDFSNPKSLNLWVVADNIRRGAAYNAVKILQYLLNE